ncbi:hypothetical protein [Paraburkholderia caffeinitolerans]|nr:hypothetical protein [Paraburkholderia caffeinitolerans]
MSGLTYSDLEAKLKQARGLTGENPIFKAVSAKYPDIEEASFVDSVNESLLNGDFLHALAVFDQIVVNVLWELGLVVGEKGRIEPRQHT